MSALIGHRSEPLFADVRGDVAVSFEFFPPKTEKMEQRLWESVQTLAPLAPRFVSVTYGAGGSTRERTHATVVRIARETDLTAAAHLTCVEASRGEVDEVARAYWDAGIRHVVALRGDPPTPGKPFAPHPQGYRNAAELVGGTEGGCAVRDLGRGLSGMPPHSPTKAADLDNLKRKIDAGADRAITQFFFSPECFFRFRDEAAAAGIDAELVPGILPVSNVAQTRKLRSRLRRQHSGLDGRLVRRAGQSPRRAPARRRHRRRGIVRPALCRRRAPVPLLHAQPRRARLCDLPPARPQTRGRNR
jgi:methylenetetrahydrofolate reductase (NADPH)